MSESKVEDTSKPVETKTEELPPLSDHDFKAYNRLAVHMNFFVRSSW